MKTKRSKVRRVPKRGYYDASTIYKILDSDFICQIGFIYDNYPIVIPITYGRKNNYLYFHGASVSRCLTTMEKGLPISINVTQVNALVLARSAFHHSLNYHSVTIFGNAELVIDENERMSALKIISDQIMPLRWDEVRLPNKNELKVTKILKLKIDEASAKIRKGQPKDNKQDYDLNIWAGIIPIEKYYKKPIADPDLKSGIPLSESVINFFKDK